MGYAIELSTDERKAKMVVQNEVMRRQEADKHMCEMQYFTHEVEGKRRKIFKLNRIQVVIFAENNWILFPSILFLKIYSVVCTVCSATAFSIR